jgi:hypothetical protein
MLDDAPLTASDLMTRDVAVVHPETSILDAGQAGSTPDQRYASCRQSRHRHWDGD